VQKPLGHYKQSQLRMQPTRTGEKKAAEG